MVIDTSISVGNILTLVGLIFGGFVFLSKFQSTVQVIVTRIEQIERELVEMRNQTKELATGTQAGLEKIGGILIEMAKSTARADAFDKRLDDTVKVRTQMQADIHSRFEGLESRLRSVETKRTSEATGSRKR